MTNFKSRKGGKEGQFILTTEDTEGGGRGKGIGICSKIGEVYWSSIRMLVPTLDGSVYAEIPAFAGNIKASSPCRRGPPRKHSKRTSR